jgi:hypothetical protein
MRLALLGLAIAAALGGCAKCDVPTAGLFGWRAACTAEPARR